MSWYKDLDLSYNPFDTVPREADDVFESQDLLAMQDGIEEAMRHHQIVLILGRTGSGKTTALNDMLRTAAENKTSNLLLITKIVQEPEKLNITNIEEAILKAIWERTGDEEPIRKTQTARLFQISRIAGKFTQNHQVVIVLDDGHAIPRKTLINLKRLQELEFKHRPRLFTIVILAHPEKMASRLEDIREFRERAMSQVKLTGLSPVEREAYISLKLKSAGSSWSALFTPGAKSLIIQSFNYPSSINFYLTQILQDAAKTGTVPVTVDIVKRYAGEGHSLKNLQLISDMSAYDIYEELRAKKLPYSLAEVRRCLTGRSDASGLTQEIRGVLVNDATMNNLTSARKLTGMNAEDIASYERLDKAMSQLKESEVDYEYLANRISVTTSKLVSIILGRSVNRLILQKLVREVEELVKQKSKDYSVRNKRVA